MIQLKLSIRIGEIPNALRNKFVSEVYAAIDNAHSIEALGIALDNYTAQANEIPGPGGRWDLYEEGNGDSILSSGGRSAGTEQSFPFVMDTTAVDIIFGLHRFATGENADIIGHLLSIDGKMKLWRPFDPRILKVSGGRIPDIHGFDIVAIAAGRISIKPFLGKESYLRITDLNNPHDSVITAKEFNPHLMGTWLAIRQITDRQIKKHPCYGIADLIRVAVGNNPKDVEVDSTHP